MKRLIAVPSSLPGGLEAPIGEHFGHCELYTLVSISGNDVNGIDIIPNIPHEQGGCMAPVRYLADKGVVTLIAGGMGMRPLMSFNEVGITVYHGGPAKTVGDAITAYVNGSLRQFTLNHTCGANNPGHQCGGH